MKKLTTILQLPIMEILNGKKVGQTKDIIMNLDSKDIAYVLDESTVASLYVIKGEEIKGVGRDVILIKTSQSIQNSQDNSELAKVLGDYYSIMGLDVITMEGNIEGEIVDLLIDEKKQKITEIELESGRTYGTDQIISISDKYIFIQDENDDTDGTEQEEIITYDEPAEEVTEAPDTQGSDYLIGMVLKEDVANEDGTFIVKSGTELTEELVNQAREYGVFANLIMNAE